MDIGVDELLFVTLNVLFIIASDDKLLVILPEPLGILKTQVKRERSILDVPILLQVVEHGWLVI